MALPFFYHYPACGTCRKATKWLAANGVAVQAIHIVENPLTAAQLGAIASAANVPIRKLFNTSGHSYRDGGFKDRLGTMSEAEMLAALEADGKLIKRPLLVVPDSIALVGFDEAAYAAAKAKLLAPTK